MNSGARFSALGRMRTVLLSAYLAISFSAFGTETRTAVIPPHYESTAGPASATVLREGLRYMGIYDPADFITAMPEGGAINAISFRLNEQVFGGERRFDYKDVEIRMSTIPPPERPLSSHFFDDYIGIDETVVFRGALKWQTEIKDGNAVNPFDVGVILQRVFEYDPRFESLVMDIRTYDENLTDSFRVDSMGPESLSFSMAGSVDRPGAVSFFLDPPIMQIEFIPVPEPSSRALLLLGVVLLGKMRTR